MKDDIDYEDFELSEEDESDVDPDEPLKITNLVRK